MQRPSNPGQARPPVAARFADKADVTALLGAFCFFLSAIEYMLPKPMPFMRLGIANLPILLAVDILPFPWFMTLAIVKVIGMSIISGTLFSFVALFSLVGTLTAALVMWGARRLGGKLISQIGVSIAGAIASNAIQIFIARYVVFGQAAWLIAPIFVAMGLVTGTALGVFAEHFSRTSKWYASASGRLPVPTDGDEPEKPKAAPDAVQVKKRPRAAKNEKANRARALRKQRFEALFSPGATALSGALIAFVFLFEQKLAAKIVLFLFFIVAAFLAGKRFSLITTILVSTGIIITNLLVPSGRVLGRIGPLTITQFALTEGIMKAITFEGLMFLSKASILQGLKLPGKLGGIVGSAFLYYDRIIEYKGRIRAATLSADADAMMSAVWEEESLPAEAKAQAERPAGPDPARAKTGNLILTLALVAALALTLL